MKKALVLSLIPILLSTAAFAETKIAKPKLPAGYEKWPYFYTISCKDQDVTIKASIFVKILPDRKLEIIAYQSFKEKPFIIYHLMGGTKGRDQVKIYLAATQGWTAFDINSNSNDIDKLLNNAYMNTMQSNSSVKSACLIMDFINIKNPEVQHFMDAISEKAKSQNK